MKIDEMDLKIISELKKDARLSMREIAKRVHLSAPSVTERVRKLEELGVIEGYTIQVNQAALGYPIDCLLQVTIRNGDYDRFRAFLETHPRCQFAYRIAGEACYVVKLSVRTIAEIEEFINAVASYAKTTTNIVFSEVKIRSELE